MRLLKMFPRAYTMKKYIYLKINSKDIFKNRFGNSVKIPSFITDFNINVTTPFVTAFSASLKLRSVRQLLILTTMSYKAIKGDES